jgi:hypothetical protein
MSQYWKEKQFDTYFSQLENFELIEPFSLKKNPYTGIEDEMIFQGCIKAKNTIHPLEISVEIPQNFPHHKLTFWTNSLRGYPHLIYESPGSKEGWFCLNTPFAETPGAQLDLEIMRLSEWIERQMHPELQPIIDDPMVRKALHRMHAYSWESIDEMNEYKKDAMLTFVGSFAEKAENFKEDKGYFNCIRNGSNRLFVVESNYRIDNQKDQVKIPYIIVDKSVSDLKDFFSIKNELDLSDKICKHLLPDFDLDLQHIDPKVLYSIKRKKEDTPIDKALVLISQAENMIKKTLFSKNLLSVANEGLNELRREVSEYQAILGVSRGYFKGVEKYHRNHWLENIEDSAMRYFCIGIRNEGDISWILFGTNKTIYLKTEKTEYDFNLFTLTVSRKTGLSLIAETAQIINDSMYFGRGSFSDQFREKKIAMIGLGAVGSMVAEALARGGVMNITLWDADVVEPGNICRSSYDISDLGESKSCAIVSRIRNISPFCNVYSKGEWPDPYVGYNVLEYALHSYIDGEFYGNINYYSQEETIKELDEFDVVIDCTASNELLHFLSYSLKDKLLISMCITNHAQNLLCLTSEDGNAFELRKMFLSKIEQDTKNFYVEGTGCYDPTFLATYSDIASLVNLAVKDINAKLGTSSVVHSAIWSHSDRGVVVDRVCRYQLESDSSIILTVGSETLLDGEDIEDSQNGILGYVFGCYSSDGKQVLVSHIVDAEIAESMLERAFTLSDGVVDYIGDFSYSFESGSEREAALLASLADKAVNEAINTNNPLLAVRNEDGSIAFYLYFNGSLQRFVESN